MIRHRVLIDIEFTVDEDRFKLAQLIENESGVCDVTAPAIRDAMTRLMLRTDWAEHGFIPLRSIVTSRPLTPEGYYEDTHVPADHGVGDA